MAYTIRCAGTVLGHSDLEHADPSMGVASGWFRPAPGYAAVRPVFSLFAAGHEDEYYAARDRLGLELVTPTGEVVPAETIHIADYAAEAGLDALEAEVIFRNASDCPASRRPPSPSA